MFTGIVTDIGRVLSIAPATAKADIRIEIATAYDTATITIGASICCAGVCLTAIDTAPGRFAVQDSAETLARTTLGAWVAGTRINLERALRAGDELGGHLVSGHVDGVARIVGCRPDGESLRLSIETPAGLAPLIAPKGSVALDGVSLTVNEVEDRPGGAARFGVNLIPHTQAATTLGAVGEGHRVNVEVDPLARYLARWHERT
ncbi:MAG: riboflavin synthase [Rhodospirillales bacterium]|nr:riboflavin synthase [Rhodospirillales bacterium]